MKINLNFIIICDQAFLTAGTNNLNLIGIFGQINTDAFPTKYPRFALVVNFDTEATGKRIITCSIVAPSGTQIAHANLPVEIRSSPFQVISNFENLTFPVPGRYELKISLDGEAVGSRTIDLLPVLKQKPGLA